VKNCRSDSTSTQEVVVLSKKSKSKSLNKQTSSFKTKKGNFRDSDFEFDGIIESEGVLEMMAWLWFLALF
jgi:transcription termination factor Rho